MNEDKIKAFKYEMGKKGYYFFDDGMCFYATPNDIDKGNEMTNENQTYMPKDIYDAMRWIRTYLDCAKHDLEKLRDEPPGTFWVPEYVDSIIEVLDATQPMIDYVRNNAREVE